MQRLPNIMEWLDDGVPLTLLIDLLSAEGPASAAIFRTESADLDWTVARHAA